MNQKRYAVASALAATAVPALVMARGHRVEEIPELPLVVDTSLESCSKTSAALATLKALGANVEVEKVCVLMEGRLCPSKHVSNRVKFSLRSRVGLNILPCSFFQICIEFDDLQLGISLFVFRWVNSRHFQECRNHVESPALW